MATTINKVTISHGKYLYPTTSGSMYVSAINLRSGISAGFVMPKDKYVEHKNTSGYTSASPTNKKEAGGFTTNKVLDVPDSHLLKIVNNQKRNGRDYLNAALVILVHKKAGLISVHSTLPKKAQTESGFRNIPIFEGCGLLLSDAEITGLGYSLCSRFVSKYRNKEEIEEAFSIKTYGDAGLSLGDFNATMTSTGLIVLSTVKTQRRRKVRFG